MLTWQDLHKIDDKIEKIIYPTFMDDEFDRGQVSSFESQVNAFQGSLGFFNQLINQNT